MVFERITWGSRSFTFTPPLQVEPKLDESGTLHVLILDELCLHVYAPTLKQLQAELGQQVAVLWDEYVLDDQHPLTPEAQRLRSNLMRRVSETT